jgi:hypothetical protein
MKKNKDPKEPELSEVYETEIEFTCPVRGLVKQKVKVKRYKSVSNQPVEDILPSKNIADKLDQKYSGLILEDESVDLLDGEG